MRAAFRLGAACDGVTCSAVNGFEKNIETGGARFLQPSPRGLLHRDRLDRQVKALGGLEVCWGGSWLSFRRSSPRRLASARIWRRRSASTLLRQSARHPICCGRHARRSGRANGAAGSTVMTMTGARRRGADHRRGKAAELAGAEPRQASPAPSSSPPSPTPPRRALWSTRAFSTRWMTSRWCGSSPLSRNARFIHFLRHPAAVLPSPDQARASAEAPGCARICASMRFWPPQPPLNWLRLRVEWLAADPQPRLAALLELACRPAGCCRRLGRHAGPGILPAFASPGRPDRPARRRSGAGRRSGLHALFTAPSAPDLTTTGGRRPDSTPKPGRWRGCSANR